MKRIHDSPLLFVAAVCSTMIPFFMWAQEAEVNELSVPPPGFVMRFERVGGYAGTHDSFWIYPDGQVINGAGKSADISPDIVMEWRKNIASVASNASVEFSMESLCMDCYVYLITIYDEGGTRTIKLSNLLKEASEEGAMTFVGMRDRLLHLVWSASMDANTTP